MKRLFFLVIIIAIIAITATATANPLEAGVKNNLESNPAALVFGGTAETVSAASGSGITFKIFERGALSGKALLQAEVSGVKNFDWNFLFEEFQVFNFRMAVVISDQPIGDQTGPLFQSMNSALQASQSGGLVKWVEIGPDMGAKYPFFHIETYEKGSYSGNVILLKEEKAVQFDWTLFLQEQEKLGKWVYVGVEIFGSTTPAPAPAPAPNPAPAPAPGSVDPNWITGSSDNPWGAEWEWKSVPDGAYAVEVVKTSTGVTEWKLVKRVGGQIMPQYEVKMTTAPSSSQELKDNFQLNSTISKGEFKLLGSWSNKNIWIYKK